MNDGINKYFILKRKNLYEINLKYLHFSLIIIYLAFLIIIKGEKSRILLNNFSSKINVVIKGSGNQSILNNTFYLEPSEVYINGISKESCKKFCEMEIM